MRIIVDKISKTYSGGNRALNDVTFSIDHNGIFSLIGKNGAGKTTLVRILSTQLLPTSGYASINDLDVVGRAKEIRENIAAVPQEARAVPWMTPIQTITSYLMWRGYRHSDARQMAMDTLRMLHMEEYENEKNRKLSGGQKRKVLVATALSSEAELIFLDEPTTGLDFISRKELWGVLRSMKRERSILLTTHYLEEAEDLGDHIGVMNNGRMVGFGTLKELRSLTKYPLSLKIFSSDFDLQDSTGEVVKVSEGEIQLFTNEDELFSLINTLVTKRIRFTVQETSLNTIFEKLVSEGDEDE